MRFTPSFLDEIRARVPVSEVVRQKVKLRKEGREWRGLSPFNAEKTPSFFVNDQKGFFHDFSSGKHGDGFTFLMETEGVSFPEAVERLAAMAGLPMPVETQERREQEQRRASQHEVLDWAAAFFEKQLAGSAGREARAYLDRRQIAGPLRQQFRIGFAPAERHALRDYLAGKGATVETMIEAGLLIHGEDIPVPYDRFRNRVMFPICDARGRVIAFGGRAMEADAHSPSKDGRSSERPIAKYLNSPETPLFHKGAALYNLHNARKAAHERGGVIAVEGYVDVIALTEAGFPQAVAPLGTALTSDQCGLLWKMAEEPVLCFDGDKAGLKAAYRAVDTALPLIGPGRSLRFVLLPEGKDPDELLRAGGPTAVADALAQPLPLVDILWMRETQAAALDTPEQRAALERRLREIVREITDETLRRHYDADIRERLNRLFLRDERRPAPPRGGYSPQSQGRRSFGPRGGFVPRGGFGAPPPVQVSPSLASSPLFRGAKTDITPREGLILLILMNHPELIETAVEELAGLDFLSSEAASFRDALLRWSELDDGGPALDVMLAESGFGPFAARLAGMSAHASLWNVRPDAAPTDAAESLRQALVLHRRASALNRELRAVEARLAQNSNEQDAARLRDIQTQLTALDGAEAALEGFGASSGRASRTL